MTLCEGFQRISHVSLSDTMSASRFKEIYDEQGFVIVPSLVEGDLFPLLQAASERVVAKTRTGIWPYRRTVGRQFPPYVDDHPDSWGVQHVMHPDLDEPIFARWYTSDALIAVAAQLLECRENELQMGEHMCLLYMTSRVLP